MRRFFAFGLLGVLVLTPTTRGQYPTGAGTAFLMVSGWYKHFLGRDPDLYGSAWVNALQAGQAPASVLAGILTSDEYYNRSGNTPEGFVRQLYLDLTGRQPLPAEMDYWVGRLYQSNRTDVAYELLLRYPNVWEPSTGGGYYPNAAPPPPALTPYYPNTYDYRRPHHHFRW